MTDQAREETCVCCGTPCRVVSDPEVTSYYEPLYEARLSALEAERDTLLRDVLWLIDCERDAAETVGAQDAERACENLIRRIEGHFHVDAAALASTGDTE